MAKKRKKTPVQRALKYVSVAQKGAKAGLKFAAVRTKVYTEKAGGWAKQQTGPCKKLCGKELEAVERFVSKYIDVRDAWFWVFAIAGGISALLF